MIFENKISIADIISIVAILATFITILQVKHQRGDSLKPFLTIKPSDNYFVYNKAKPFSNNNFDLYLSNIGGHLAKNASIEINICNIPSNLLSSEIEINQHLFALNKKAIYMLHKSLQFTYIEPQEKHYLAGKLDNYIILLCNIYLDLFKSNKLEKNIFNVGEILIKISYYNIIDHNFKNYLSLTVNPISISDKEINFSIDIKELTKKTYKLKNNL
ncbi:MAG: hypothetical protein K2K60_05105 [Clostridia bacterium]|nr:hypothetical protein [Clostridia bacterium]